MNVSVVLQGTVLAQLLALPVSAQSLPAAADSAFLLSTHDPLGIPMSERAKRAQVEQAVRRLLSEGPGAMMGATLLSVDAAELGNRSMVDSRRFPPAGALRLPWPPLGRDGPGVSVSSVLSSHIKRLTLRNLSSRGKRYDIVVDASGRRKVPHANGTGR